MKYLKLLLIPVLGFMFMVPVKADDEVPFPEWAKGDHYYIVYENFDGLPSSIGTLYAAVITSIDDLQVFGTGYAGQDKGLYVPESSLVASYVLRPGSNAWKSYGLGQIERDDITYREVYSFNKIYRMKYSNFDVYVDGELFFRQTPLMTLPTAKKVALESLVMEVQGASGKISLIGGMILGLLLVPVLVIRLRLWVRV